MIASIITARIGSKSIHEKNIKDFCGKPLSFWVLNELQKSVVDKIFFLTDSFKIAHIVREFNLPKIQIDLVQEMNDQSMTDDVIYKYIKNNELSFNEYSHILIAQVTSPLVSYKDYNIAIENLSKGYNTVISSAQGIKFYWNLTTKEPINHPKDKRLRRQDYFNNVYENGAFYLTDLKMFMKSKYRVNGNIDFHIMPEYTGFEIDNDADWIICENLYRKYLYKPFLYKNAIKLLVCDIDGVMTDGGVYLNRKGEEIKKFNVKDGHGFRLLKNLGIKIAIITSGKSDIHTFRFLKKNIKVDYLIENEYNKFQVLNQICELENLSLDQVAYIGDDIIDEDCLKNVGLAVCPNDANEKVKKLHNIFVLNKKGGEGCVRELIDLLLS